MTSHFRIFAALCFLLLAAITVKAQNFSYTLHPTLTDVDDFTYDSLSASQNVLAVKSKGKWGVKTVDNQTLIPIIYDSVKIEKETSLIIAYNHALAVYYNIKGRTMSFQQADSLLNIQKRKKWMSHAKQAEISFYQSTHNLKWQYDEKSLPAIYIADKENKILDTILLQDNTTVYRTKNNYTLINGSIYNENGEKITLSQKYTRLVSCSNGLILAKHLGFWGVINEQGKILIPIVYTRIDTVAHYPYFILERNSAYILTDSLSKRIFPQAAPIYIHIDRLGKVALCYNDKTLVYDAAAKTIKQLDYVLDKPLDNTDLWLIKKYGNVGCAELLTGEEIIPAKYKAIWEAGKGYLIGADGIRNNGQEKAMDVYFQNKLVHQNKLIQFLPFADGILTESATERCILNSQYLDVYCLPRGTFYPASMGQLISAYSDETGPGVFLSQNFAARNFNSPYETAIDLKQKLTINSRPGLWVRYAKNWGVIDYNGNWLINYQWDELKEIAGMPQIFKVKKDGKWGVIRVVK